MEDASVTLQRATLADQTVLLELIALFCQEDGHSFDEGRIRGALPALLEHDDFGRIYLIVTPDGTHDTHGDGSGENAKANPVGYLVTTWGYSLESGGREALIDEIFVRERGQGLGASAMNALLTTLKAEGFTVVFLETERANHRARRFYARFGFEEDDSIWMSRPLNPKHSA